MDHLSKYNSEFDDDKSMISSDMDDEWFQRIGHIGSHIQIIKKT
jgi:hypothetical protein